MSKEMREQIARVKNWKQFMNEGKENEVIFLTWMEFKSDSSLYDGFVTKASFKFKNKRDKEIRDVSDINQFAIEGGSYFCTTYNCIEHYRENPGYSHKDDFIINDDAIIAISENQFIMNNEEMKEEIMSKADGFYCSPYDTYGLVIWNKEKIKKK